MVFKESVDISILLCGGVSESRCLCVSQVQPSVLFCVATNILNKCNTLESAMRVCFPLHIGGAITVGVTVSLCSGACECQDICEPVSRGCVRLHPSTVWTCVCMFCCDVCVRCGAGCGCDVKEKMCVTVSVGVLPWTSRQPALLRSSVAPSQAVSLPLPSSPSQPVCAEGGELVLRPPSSPSWPHK